MKKLETMILIFFAVVAVFGDSAIEFFGETRCFAIAHFVGEFLAPIFLIGTIALILYFFWYFLWDIPKKILVRLKDSD